MFGNAAPSQETVARTFIETSLEYDVHFVSEFSGLWEKYKDFAVYSAKSIPLSGNEFQRLLFQAHPEVTPLSDGLRLRGTRLRR